MAKEIIQFAFLTILIIAKVLIDRKDAKEADEDINNRIQLYFEKAMERLDAIHIESAKANRVILDDNARTRKTISELVKSESTKTGEKVPTIVPEELCEDAKKIYVNDDWVDKCRAVSRETDGDELLEAWLEANRRMWADSRREGMRCKDCNTPVYSVDNFCPHCGRRLK